MSILLGPPCNPPHGVADCREDGSRPALPAPIPVTVLARATAESFAERLITADDCMRIARTIARGDRDLFGRTTVAAPRGRTAGDRDGSEGTGTGARPNSTFHRNATGPSSTSGPAA